MAYMRGHYYLWSDMDDRLDVWVEDGHDRWDENWAWVARRYREQDPMNEAPRPSGVAIPQEVMDEYVVMRFAEMVRAGLVGSAIDRALAKHSGNGGSTVLEEQAGRIRDAGKGD